MADDLCVGLIWNSYVYSINHTQTAFQQGLWDKFYQGVQRLTLGPLASGALVKTWIACLYYNQYTDKTATMLRFRNGITIILATGLHK